MKMIFGILAAVAVVAAENSFAQNSTDPQLPYGAPQVVQLSKAGINDGTILTYIQNSGTVYNLNADQIVYLKQQGVSDTIINAMINQKTAVAAQAAVAAQTQSASTTPMTVQNNYNYVAPAVPMEPVVTTMYVQTVPSSTVYVIPDTRTYYYNSCYSRPHFYYGYNYCRPSVSVSFGFRGGYVGFHSRWR
ncbi:MAG TPA: hypothetical protein VFV23_03660 [Verrucomicrobiae bacterium]|nr:hypothetical protein [Verrucomicrobiae bacterium]